MFWDGDSILRFHVMRKSDGQILSTKYEADPQGFFHIFNAYEEDGHLILDAPFKSTPISYGVFTIDKLAADPDTVQVRKRMIIFTKTNQLLMSTVHFMSNTNLM